MGCQSSLKTVRHDTLTKGNKSKQYLTLGEHIKILKF